MISAAERNALQSLAKYYGVSRSYVGMGRRRVNASADSTLAVLSALGADLTGDPRTSLARALEQRWQQPLEPVVVAWNGNLSGLRRRIPSSAANAGVQLDIALEDGRRVQVQVPAEQRALLAEQMVDGSRFVEVALTIPERLPLGYHQLHAATSAAVAEALILSAPQRCYTGQTKRGWGVFAPLYATRQNRDKAMGDLADLEQLLTWTSSMGGNVVATLPISAAFLTEPFEPSPYAPASRLFWNELFVDLERLVHNTDCVPARNRARADEWQHAMRTAASGDYVDYRVVAELKRHIMETLADWFFLQHREASDDFRDFLTLYPDAELYARFRAAGERQTRGWPAWPARMQGGKLEPQDYDDDVVRYHLYAQFVMHGQLSALAERARRQNSTLYLDMPLGVHADSFDVWCHPDLFVTGVSAGAPPDAFFSRGQNWGFPPLNPLALRADRYQYLRRVLRTQFRYAGMLRIDHIMSLHRLFFVPAGFDATQGVYVRYPADELYAVLAIESQRHGSMVVGEDLGTVPAEVRKSMKKHGVKRMFVLQFEAHAGEPPVSAVPASAVASLNTHDMPPFAAYWNAHDAELRYELGLLDAHEVGVQREQREELARALSAYLRARNVTDARVTDRLLNRKLDTAQALQALLEWLARSPADVVLINLEDLWLEERPQNIPGTAAEKPNWRRRMRYTLQQIMSNDEIAALLDHINAARQEGQMQV